MQVLFSNRTVVSLVSGSLLGLSFITDYSAPFLAGLGLFLWFTYLRGTQTEKWNPGILFFLPMHFIALHWLWFVTGPLSQKLFSFLGPSLCNALMYSLLFMLLQKASKKWQVPAGVKLAVAWMSVEFIQSNWELEFPWVRLGYVFAEFPWLIGAAAQVGVVGLAGLFFFFILGLEQLMHERKGNWLLGLPLVWLALNAVPVGGGEKVLKARMVQPNEDPYTEKFVSDQHARTEKLWGLAGENLSEVDVVVFPETAFQGRGLWERRWEYSKPISTTVDSCKAHPNMDVIIGASSYRKLKEGEAFSAATRSIRNSEVHYESYNTAALFNADTEVIYHKSKLVAGVEEIPFLNSLPFLKSISMDFGGAVGALGKQRESVVFQGKKANYAPVICYESVFPAYLREWLHKGAEVLVLMTNDAWWGFTDGHVQHLKRAKVLAATLGLPVIRSANTGISALINCKGEVTESTEYWKEAVLDGELVVNQRPSFFVAVGEWAGYLSLLTLLLGSAVSRFMVRKGQ